MRQVGLAQPVHARLPLHKCEGRGIERKCTEKRAAGFAAVIFVVVASWRFSFLFKPVIIGAPYDEGSIESRVSSRPFIDDVPLRSSVFVDRLRRNYVPRNDS